jgi:thiol:disulfide interchange protein DsbD
MAATGGTPVANASAAQAGSAAPPMAPLLSWESSEKRALERAASEHKPLLIDFGASWCAACKEIDERTFPDPRVRAEAARFVTLHVDASDEDAPDVDALRRKYKIVGLPVVILFDRAGKEVSRFTEFVPPERLVPALRAASAGSSPE